MAKMTLDQLQIFMTVAQHLHFTRAAEMLYITQSSVSAAIQTLEKQYGVKLFHRVGRHVELTDAGKMLQQKAVKILNEVNLVEQELQQYNSLEQGEIKIGTSQTIGNYKLPPLINQFRHRHPGIKIDCTLGNTEEIANCVVNGQFDLGLVEGVLHQNAECLEFKVVGSHHLHIVVGQFHPWFHEGTVSVSALSNTAWVMREVGSGTRTLFERALTQWDIEPNKLNIIAELKSGAMIKAAVENDNIAAVLSEMTIYKEQQLGTLRAITLTGVQNTDLEQMMLPFVLIKHRQRFLNPACQAFEQFLIQQDAR